MSLQDILHLGSDKTLEFTIFAEDGVTPLHLTNDITGLLVILYHQVDSSILAKYSRDVYTGFDNANFVVVDAPNGRFDIKLQAEVTRLAKPSALLAEVKVQFNNADFSNTNFHTIQAGIEIAQIKTSLSKDEDLF